MSKDPKSWVVTTTGDRSLTEMAKDLRKSGVKVEAVLKEIGCITISGSDDIARKARKVKGVADVSANPSIDIGPPNSSDTW